MNTSDEGEARGRFEDVSRHYVSHRQMTILAFKTELIERILPGVLWPTTILLYEQALRKFAEIVGDKRLKELTPYEVEFFKSRRLREVSATKVNMDFRTLRAAFNRAVKFKMMDVNPFNECSNVSLPEEEPQFLSQEEFGNLLRVVDDDLMRDLITLTACTAMRLGEVTNLRWGSVDLRRGFIHLENGSGFRLKNRRKRSVPLNREAQRILSSRRRDSEYVFPNKMGLPYRGRVISEKFKKYARKAGLPDGIHFHSLRHTGATWLVEKDVPLVYVQKILGHSSIMTTMTYAHATGEHLKESVGRLDSFFAN